MKKIYLLLFLTILAISTPLTHAGNKPGAITLTVNGNYFIYSPQRNAKNNAAPSLALAYNFTQQFAGEASIGLMHVNGKNSTTHDQHGYIYSLDAIYRTPVYRCIEPYLLA